MQQIDSILTVADQYDAIVFDQWGVLHNGSAPYPQAVGAIKALAAQNVAMGVLSNSGKSAQVNQDRITAMGFPATAFSAVMTSGEALHRDFANGGLRDIKSVFPMTAKPEDAKVWAGALPLIFTQTADQADAVLLMGLPDLLTHDAERAVLETALTQGKTLICSNPDRTSPRADGQMVESPGALAHDYADAGGSVLFYGKPHRPVFDAVAADFANATRILMVGDSPEHDIAGAQTVGWDTLFISGGIHAGQSDLGALFDSRCAPTYTLPTLR